MILNLGAFSFCLKRIFIMLEHLMLLKYCLSWIPDKTASMLYDGQRSISTWALCQRTCCFRKREKQHTFKVTIRVVSTVRCNKIKTMVHEADWQGRFCHSAPGRLWLCLGFCQIYPWMRPFTPWHPNPMSVRKKNYTIISVLVCCFNLWSGCVTENHIILSSRKENTLKNVLFWLLNI